MIDQKAIEFQRLHAAGNCFIMANAWNAGSAVLLEQAGFSAIGTTSAGIAYSHGLADAEAALSFDSALGETCEISNAVSIPVSMDSENAYADAPPAAFENMKRIAGTGVVGASIEDFCGDRRHPLYDIELAVERVRAAKQAVAELDYPFVLTARAECYLYGSPDPFKDSVERVNRYREAGADELVAAVDGPVNVVMGLSGTPISLAQLRQAGVTRISIGGSLARATLGLVRRAAQEMLEQGSFNFASEQIPDAELSNLFSRRSDS
jgi:2-methylisocitrate lyase-like PEP mutase family enzyme